MNKLLLSLLLVIIANVGTWFQFQGQFWSNKMIYKSPYYVMIVGDFNNIGEQSISNPSISPLTDPDLNSNYFIFCKKT